MSVKLLDLNFRKNTIDEDAAFKEWEFRVGPLIDRLQGINPAIITAQECEPSQAEDIQNGLGLNWTYWGNNVKIFWNTLQFQAVEGTQLQLTMPSGARVRWMWMLRLQHIASGWGAWIGSTHLAANSGDEEEPNPQGIRETQMKLICQAIDQHLPCFPAFPGDGATPNLILGGDINDYSQTGGVRKVALSYGLKPLQVRVPAPDVHGEDMNSFNGWQRTKLEGRWIDEIFSRGQAIEECSIRRMDKDVMSNYGSDHNALEAIIPITTY